MTRTLLCLALAVSLAACGGMKQKMGLETAPPDEFLVTRHAPLEMPPDYALRSPVPGAERPQEARPVDTARAAALGGQAAPVRGPATSGEAALLREAGTAGADPEVRAKLAVESPALTEENKPVVEKLLGVTWGTSSQESQEALDPVAEAKRMKGQAAE